MVAELITGVILTLGLALGGLFAYLDIKSVRQFYKKIAADLCGQVTANGVSIQYEQHTYQLQYLFGRKNQPGQLRLVRTAASTLPFRIVKRSNKILSGINQDQSFLEGIDQAFAKKFYIETPVPEQMRTLLTKNEVTEQIAALWSHGCEEAVWESKELSVVWPSKFMDRISQVEVNAGLSLLSKIAAQAPVATPLHNTKEKIGVVGGSISLSALAISSLLFLFTIPYWPVKLGPLIIKVLIISLPLAMLHSIWLKFITRNRLRGLQSFVTFSVLGFITIPATCFTLMVILNGACDRTGVATQMALIVEKKQVARSGTQDYFLVVQPQTSSYREEIKVNRNLFQKASVGDLLHINLGQGLLGIPWQKSIEVTGPKSPQ